MTTIEYEREVTRLAGLSMEELKSESAHLTARWRSIEARVRRAQILFRIIVCVLAGLWLAILCVVALDVGTHWRQISYLYPDWISSAVPIALAGVWVLLSSLLWSSPPLQAFLQFLSGFTDELREERDYRRDLALGSQNLAMGMEWSWRGD